MNGVSGAGRPPRAREAPGHVALFTRYLTMGGIQKVVVQLANGFARRGCAVDVVLAKGGGGLVHELDAAVRVVDLACNRVWTAPTKLARYLQEARPDALLSAEASSNLASMWGKLLSPAETRFVVSIHQNTSLHAKNGSMWYSRLMPPLIRMFYPWADRVVTVSTGIEEDLWRIAPRAAAKATVVYNPIVDAALVEKAAAPVPHPWLADDAVPVVLGVGRLAPEKRFDLLVRAFARVSAAREARLLILGDGNQRPALERLVRELGLEDRVDLHAFVSNPYAYMARASVLALSSIFEGLPTVLIEALACGCPIVSTDCPSGPREILDDGAYGQLVPVGDEAGLAAAILHVLEHPPDPEALRRRAQEFTAERSIDRYLQVLFPEAIHRPQLPASQVDG